MGKLDGKAAVVTGASRGIGAAIAERLARDGASVVVNYNRGAKEAEAVVARIAAAGGKAVGVQADLARTGDAAKLFSTAVDRFGRLDILVNNAGVFEFLPLGKVTEDHFDRQFNTNVKGLLFASQGAVAAFGEKGGVIVNVSSGVSIRPVPGACVYSATKAAVDAITKSLAAELAPRVRVNSVLPGPVESDGIMALVGSEEFRARMLARSPAGRLGQPDDIANVVSFLVSDDAAWVTGEQIAAMGGLR